MVWHFVCLTDCEHFVQAGGSDLSVSAESTSLSHQRWINSCVCTHVELEAGIHLKWKWTAWGYQCHRVFFPLLKCSSSRYQSVLPLRSSLCCLIFSIHFLCLFTLVWLLFKSSPLVCVHALFCSHCLLIFLMVGGVYVFTEGPCWFSIWQFSFCSRPFRMVRRFQSLFS